MKENVIQYVYSQGTHTFAEKTLCDVDFLVFAQFVYIKFDGYIGGIDCPEQKMTLRKLAKTANRDELFSDERYRKDNERLFDAMAASRRYGGMVLSNYMNVVDTDIETQFSALTLRLNAKASVVVFRGTDENLIGWKEDFHLFFWDKVPGQAMALGYFRGIAEKVSGRLYLAGHSKGGNLAVYAAMGVDEEIRDRIEKVYSFDGPGFRPEVLERMDYEGIRSKVRKFIPQSSLVGMLFENRKDYQVIESSGVGVGQHNPYTWKIHEGKMIRLNEIMPGSKYMDEKLNEWISSLSLEEAEFFTETIFSIAYASDSETLLDFSGAWMEKANQMINAYKQLQPEKKEQMQKIVKELFRIANPIDGKKGKILEQTKKPIENLTQQTGTKVKQLKKKYHSDKT